MLEGQFGSLGNFIKKRYKIIIIVWLVALVVLLPFAAESPNWSLANHNFHPVIVSHPVKKITVFARVPCPGECECAVVTLFKIPMSVSLK